MKPTSTATGAAGIQKNSLLVKKGLSTDNDLRTLIAEIRDVIESG